jgi:hypothetical protein
MNFHTKTLKISVDSALFTARMWTKVVESGVKRRPVALGDGEWDGLEKTHKTTRNKPAQSNF